MRIAAIIPARYASTRFPGKPLALINGKSMIMRVYEQVLRAKGITLVAVATDDSRIYNHIVDQGGHVVMTAESHTSGTSRCEEAMRILSSRETLDAVINVQGDEPFIHPEQITQVASLLHSGNVQIASLCKKISSEAELLNPNVVKVVMNASGHAMYFSRHPVPYVRNSYTHEANPDVEHFRHIGIYGYLTEALMRIVSLPEVMSEKSEMLEQLRWLHFGYPIRMGITDLESEAVDSPDDLLKFMNKA